MSKKGKCFDVRYVRSDVVFTVFAKDENEAWDEACKLRDEQFNRDEQEVDGGEGEESEWETEEADREEKKESES